MPTEKTKVYTESNNFIVILSICLWFSRKRNHIGYWTMKERIRY